MKQPSKSIEKTIIERQSKEILRALPHFTYFAAFTEECRQEACTVGKIKNFELEETIFGDGKGIPDYTYFILSGKCQMIELFLVKTRYVGKRKFYSLFDVQDDSSVQNNIRKNGDVSPFINITRELNNKIPKDNIQVEYMQVFILYAGGCFGLGESMIKRRIVALEPVQCLLLPRHWLMKRNPANIWPRIKHYLERKIPSRQKIFEEFKRQQEWKDYKKSTVEDVIIKKKSHNLTSLHDVPYSVRLHCNFDYTELNNHVGV